MGSVQASVAACERRGARLPVLCRHHPQKQLRLLLWARCPSPFGAAGGGAVGLDASSSPLGPAVMLECPGSRHCPRGSSPQPGKQHAPVSPGHSDPTGRRGGRAFGVPGRCCHRQGQADSEGAVHRPLPLLSYFTTCCGFLFKPLPVVQERPGSQGGLDGASEEVSRDEAPPARSQHPEPPTA